MEHLVTINLRDFSRVNLFVRDVSSFEADVDAYHGRYIINAKSVMAIFSLDLSQPLNLVIRTDDEAEIERFKEVMKKYEV